MPINDRTTSAFGNQNNLVIGLEKPSHSPRGLFWHYLHQAFVKEFINGSRYPFFKRYLNSTGHVYRSIRSIWSIMWSFKFLIGVVSDVFPVFGFKRKPYIFLGWLVTCTGLGLAFSVPYPEPYYSSGDQVNGTCSKYSVVHNPSARDSVFLYAVLLGLAKFGIAMMDCSADGRMVELTKTETSQVRGTIVSIAHLVQKLGSVVNVVLLMFAMNAPEYGGSFCFGVSFRWLVLFYLLFSLAPLCVSLIVIEEPKVQPGERVTAVTVFKELWAQLKEVSTFRVTMFVFVYSFAYNFLSSAGPQIESKWVQVTPLVKSIFKIVSIALHSLGIYLYKCFFLTYNWRYLIFISFIFVLIPNMMVDLLAVFGIIRNQFFYFTDDVIEALPEGVIYIILMQIAAYASASGVEGTLFAVLMSIYTLTQPFAITMGNIATSPFNVSDDNRYERDSYEDRLSVFLSLLVSYAVKIILLPVFLTLVPAESDHVDVAINNSSSGIYAFILCMLFIVMLVFSLCSSLLALNPQTACLVWVGGRGCK